MGESAHLGGYACELVWEQWRPDRGINTEQTLRGEQSSPDTHRSTLAAMADTEPQMEVEQQEEAVVEEVSNAEDAATEVTEEVEAAPEETKEAEEDAVEEDAEAEEAQSWILHWISK